jgi:hypothetical protein
MADDNELKIEVVVDPSRAVSGLGAVAGAVNEVRVAAAGAGPEVSNLGKSVEVTAERAAAFNSQLGAASARLGTVVSGFGQFGYSLSILARAIPAFGDALASAFPLIAIVAVGEAIATLVDKVQKAEDGIRKTTASWADLASEAILGAEATDLQNKKLEDQIAKLEGRPSTNQLREALIETRIEAGKLTKELSSALEKTLELFEKSDVGVLGAALEGLAATSAGFGLNDKFAAVKVQIGLASTALIQYQEAQSSLTKAIQDGDATEIASAKTVLAARKAASDQANIAAQNANEAARKQIEIDKEQRISALTASHGSLVIPGGIEAGLSRAEAEKQVTAEFRQQDAAVATTATRLQENLITEKELAAQGDLRAKVGGEEREAAITADLIKQHDELSAILIKKAEISGQAGVEAARARGAGPDVVAAAERRSEQESYARKRAKLEGDRDLASQNAADVRKYDTEIELLKLGHIAKMDSIDAQEQEGVRKRNAEELTELESINRAFVASMRERENEVRRGQEETRAFQVGQQKDPIADIEEQIKQTERQASLKQISDDQEEKALKSNLALLEKQREAASDRLSQDRAALEAESAKTLQAGQLTPGPGQFQPGTADYAASLAQQKALQAEIEKTELQQNGLTRSIDSTKDAIFKLNTSSATFFERMRNEELSAGVSWKSVADQFEKSWQSALTSVNQQFSNSVGQWILHGGSFVRAMQNMGAELVANLAEQFVKMGLVMLENWLMTLLGMKVSQSVSSASIIGAHAAEAGAAGVASWAGAPWPIDTGAPAFGAAMSAAALAFLPAASAAGGGILGADTLVAAHRNEMILPARISQTIQNLVSGNSGMTTNNNATTASSGNNIGRLQFSNTQHISGSNFNASEHVDDIFLALQAKLKRRGYAI